MAFISSGRRHGYGSGGTTFLIAFGAPKTSHRIVNPGIPTHECGKGIRVTLTNVPALTFENDQVLPELIVQLLNLNVPHLETVHKHSTEIKSLSGDKERGTIDTVRAQLPSQGLLS